MKCLFTRDGEKNGRAVVRCVRPGCGMRLYSSDPDKCYAKCRADMGLGDRFAVWLSRRGITKAAYRRFKVRCGFSDACNCAERQITLNRLGELCAAMRRRLFRKRPQATPTDRLGEQHEQGHKIGAQEK